MEENKKKGIPGWAIVLIVFLAMGTVVTIIMMIFGVFSVTKKMGNYTGNWLCDDRYTVNVSLINFNMYDGDGTYNGLWGEYDVEDLRPEGNSDAYTINVTTKKIIMNGVESSTPRTTQFQLVIDNSNKNKMKLINTTANTIYDCVKVK